MFVVILAMSVRRFVEHPAQLAIGAWWKKKRAAQKERAAAV
jgi:hypothetical protein